MKIDQYLPTTTTTAAAAATAAAVAGKLKQQKLYESQSSTNNYENNSFKNQQPSYFVWQQHNISLEKSLNYGYGIAISGGQITDLNINKITNNNNVFVSDVVPNGPADGKLMINDKILSVNGVNVENVEHSFVLKLLKEAQDFIHLSIKRKINNYSQQQQQHYFNYNNDKTDDALSNKAIDDSKQRHNMAIEHTAAIVMSNYNNHSKDDDLNTKISSVSLLKPFKVNLTKRNKGTKESFGVVLGCKYYIKEILPDSIAASEATLCEGDVVLKINDQNIENITLNEAKKLLLKPNGKENKVQLVVKRDSSSNYNKNSTEPTKDSNENPPPPPPPPQAPPRSNSIQRNKDPHSINKKQQLISESSTSTELSAASSSTSFPLSKPIKNDPLFGGMSTEVTNQQQSNGLFYSK
jgi:tight junction protein 3